MKENLIAFLLNGIWGELGLEDFRTLGETKDARFWTLGFIDLKTLGF